MILTVLIMYTRTQMREDDESYTEMLRSCKYFLSVMPIIVLVIVPVAFLHLSSALIMATPLKPYSANLI